MKYIIYIFIPWKYSRKLHVSNRIITHKYINIIPTLQFVKHLWQYLIFKSEISVFPTHNRFYFHLVNFRAIFFQYPLVQFVMLANPLEILGNEEGWVRGVRCIRMELGEPDESGRRSPKAVPGSEFEIPCDTVIMSLGTSPNPLIASTTEGLQTTRWGGLIANDEGATTREGVFAGGDAVTGAATVILAMGAGRKAAAAIDAYIQGKGAQ